jgi:hypothetical protein
MTAQPIERPGDPRVLRIRKTIRAIADALPREHRPGFLQEVMEAEQGEPLDQVIHRGWLTAMRPPGWEQRAADARAGRNLCPLPDLIEEGA